MRIEIAITELLYRYQCVTVPGYGAFITENIPSQYIPTAQVFSPPKKRLSFNVFIKNNDGLLANHLMQKENISYDLALRLINIMVEEWMDKLKINKLLVLDKIGRFEVSSQNNLVFIPCEKSNFDINSFGLLPVQFQMVVREKEFVPLILEQPKNLDSSNSESSISKPETLEVSKKSTSWLRYAAAFVVFASVAAGVSGHFYKLKIEKENRIIANKIQNQVTQEIQKATFFIENPLPAITVTFQNPKLNYHVVGGAFKIYENAEKLLKILKSEGFNAKIAEINQYGLYPVYYASFETNEEAMDSLNLIKNTSNKDAWILFSE